KQAQAPDAAQSIEPVLRQSRLVPLERATILPLQIIDRGRESDRSGDVRRARAELACRVLELLGGVIDIVRHVRSGLIGCHLLESLAAGPQYAGSHGAQHLVAGE